MALLAIRFSEEKRRNLAIFIAISHWVCILPCTVCLLLALYIFVEVSKKISFIEGYNGTVLPFFLAILGIFGVIYHSLFGKVAFSNSLSVKRDKWKKFLLPALIASVVFFFWEIITGIICIVHIQGMKDSFTAGLKLAMSAYKDDIKTKVEVDMLQISYECCGMRSYKDWFHVTWIPQEYLSAKKALTRAGPSHITIDDAPYSCCSPHVLRPCIYHHVHDNDLHYNYDYHKSTTLYKLGCTDKLMEFYGNHVMKPTVLLIVFLSDVQFILVICIRFLQTSIISMTSQDKEEGVSSGYLFTAPKETFDLDDKTVWNERLEGNFEDLNTTASAKTSFDVNDIGEADTTADTDLKFSQNFEIEENFPSDKRKSMNDVVTYVANNEGQSKSLSRYHSFPDHGRKLSLTYRDSFLKSNDYNTTTEDVAGNMRIERRPHSTISFKVRSPENSRVLRLAENIGPKMMRSFSRYSEIELSRLVHETASQNHHSLLVQENEII